MSMKGIANGRLSCGCGIRFREGTEGSPVTVVVDVKGSACPHAFHVQNLPVFDHREALRPSTRVGPPVEGEYEEEG